MVLIIGGAHQGKLDFARKRFALAEYDIHICKPGQPIDLSRRCLAYLDQSILGRVQCGADPMALLEDLLQAPARRILIVNDVTGGIVPVDPVMRAWREAVGRMNQRLAQRADEVWRLFCGLPERLK